MVTFIVLICFCVLPFIFTKLEVMLREKKLHRELLFFHEFFKLVIKINENSLK